MAQQTQSEIRYLTPPSVDVKKKKYCRFKKSGIKYIDYKDPEFLKKNPLLRILCWIQRKLIPIVSIPAEAMKPILLWQTLCAVFMGRMC